MVIDIHVVCIYDSVSMTSAGCVRKDGRNTAQRQVDTLDVTAMRSSSELMTGRTQLKQR